MAYQPSKKQFDALKASQANESGSCHIVLIQPAVYSQTFEQVLQPFKEPPDVQFVMRKWGEFTYKPEPIAMEGHLPGGIAHATLANEWGKVWHTS